MASFNLLTDPWIPVADNGGAIRELGIIETLSQAHDLSGIVDPAPPVQFGIYRLLLAVVIDAFRISELEQIESLFGEGRLPAALLREYARQTGEDRFDLFHPRTPFMQTPPVDGDENAAERTTSIARLLQHLPSGSFATHFHHIKPDEQAFSPAACARGLATISPFMTAGGAGYSPSINGIPPWYVLVCGRNLFETLVLNCCALPISGLDSNRPAAWRSQERVMPKKETRCGSILEGLTWQPRQIRFIPGPGGTCTYSGKESPILVRQMIFSFGLKAAGGWTDPQVAYRITDKGPSPLRPSEDRELWRDIGPLMLLRKEDYESDNGKVRFSRPVIVEQYMQLKRGRMVPAGIGETIEIYGMRTDGKMKIFEWQYERLSLPPGVADYPGSGRLIQGALDMAEGVAYSLKQALKKAYPRQGASNERAFDTGIQQSKREFWAVLRPRFEAGFLRPLPAALEDQDGALADLIEQWKRTLYEVGQGVFERAVEPLDADADSLRRQVDARNQFRLSLYRILFQSKDKKTEQDRKGGKRES